MIINDATLFKKELLNTDRLLINTLTVPDIRDWKYNFIHLPYGLKARITDNYKFILYRDTLDKNNYKIGEFSKILIHNIFYEIKNVSFVLYPYRGSLYPIKKGEFTFNELTSKNVKQCIETYGLNISIAVEIGVYALTNENSVKLESLKDDICAIFCEM